MKASIDVVSRIHELMLRADRSNTLHWELSANRNAALASAKVSREQIDATAKGIGKTLLIRRGEEPEFYSFAEFLSLYMLDYRSAIDVYLAIIRKNPFFSQAYRNLMDVYHYSYEKLRGFDFLGNIRAVSEEGVEPIFVCMSYTYMGRVLERLGRFSEALAAYKSTHHFRNDPRGYSKTAEYAEREMRFLAQACQFKETSWARTSDKPPLLLCSVFFGSTYRSLFETVAGPTFFSDATISSLKEKWSPVLLIICPLADRMAIQTSPFLKELSRELPVRLITLPRDLVDNYPDPPPPGHKYHPAMPYAVSGLSQIAATEIARRHGADLVSIPPDAIFAAEAGVVLRKHVEAGSQIVFTSGIRLSREGMLQDVAGGGGTGLTRTAFSAAELSGFALRNLHSSTEACIVDEEKVTYPGMLWWRIAEQGLFGHCFQMHPIFVAASALRRSFMRRFDSIDGDFVHSLLPDEASWESVSVISSGNEAIMFELTTDGFTVPRLFEPADLPGPAAWWVTSVMRPLNFWLFKHRIIIGDDGIQGYSAAARSAHEIVERFEELREWVQADPIQPLLENVPESTEINRLIATFSEEDLSPRPDTMRGTKDWKDLRVLFAVAIWGESYIDNFLALSLPSLLADGNLGNLPNADDCLFLIHTREEDRRYFERSSYYQQLTELIPVEFRFLQAEIFSSDRKYEILNDSQSEAIQEARDFDGIVFLYADFVWAEGVIHNALRYLAEDCDAVVMPVPPLVLEDFSELLDKNLDRFLRPKNGCFSINIPPRELVAIGKQVLHPMMRDNTIDRDANTSNPAYVLWLGPNGDYLIRCFHIHPLVLRVQTENAEFWNPLKGTLDEEFVPRILKAFDRVRFIHDSDDAAVVSLTSRNFPLDYLPKGHRLDAEKIAVWAESHASPAHKMMFSEYSIWHSCDIDPETWKPLITRSEKLARSVANLLALPDSVAQAEAGMGFMARASRSHRFGGFGHPGLLHHTGDAGQPAAKAVVERLPPTLLAVEILTRVADYVPRHVRRRLLRFVPSGLVRRVKSMRHITVTMLKRDDPRLAVFNVLFNLPVRDLLFALFRSALRRRS